MRALLVVLLLVSVLGLGTAVNLQSRYPFSTVLLDTDDQYYALYWNFTRSTESIYFAVNVSTTGWVGFGLSPNGQMPSSDVVIGWVSEGTGYFHVSSEERQWCREIIRTFKQRTQYEKQPLRF